MARRVRDPVDAELHLEAKELIRRHVAERAMSLILEAKNVAFRKGVGVVDAADVEEALENIERPERRRWVRQLVLVLGGAFFGAFVQGFLEQVSAGNALLIVAYAVFGLVGMAMIMGGLFGGRV